MTAETLRRAAAKIRETAQAATPGPWWANPIASEAEVDVYAGTGTSEDIAVADGAYRADAEHIATWSPDVAELVAETLELASYDVWYPVSNDEPEPVYDRPDAHHDPAVRLARRILGEDA